MSQLALRPPSELPVELPDQFSFQMEGLYSARNYALREWDSLVSAIRARGYDVSTSQSNETGNKYAHCKRPCSST